MRPSEAIKIMRLARALATAAVKANSQTKRFKAMGLPVSSTVRNARALAEERLMDYLNSLYNVQNETKEKS